MKNKDLKKGKESIIGKIIYGFLLFMPLIAIFSTILINTFNMAGKQETEITYKYESNEINNWNDIQIDKIYRLNLNNKNATDIIYDVNAGIECDWLDGSISLFQIDSNYQDDNAAPLEVGSVLRFNADSIQLLSFFDSTYIYELTNITCDITVKITNIYYEDDRTAPYEYSYFSNTDYNIIENVETHNLEAEDIFYRSVDKVEESSLFNWAENSAIYTGIASTCTQLSITNTFIPLLLAYWLIISVIYILYDIILMILIILHNKIHQIQDSI